MGRLKGGSLVLAIALSVRLLFVAYALRVGPDFIFTDDSRRYDRLALNIFERGQVRAAPFALADLGLGEDFEDGIRQPGYFTDPDFYDGPELKRLPLFPLFLGLFYKIAGYAPAGWLLLQALLGSLTCWLVYLAGRRLGGEAFALLAGLITALNPRLVLHTGQIQVEVFFILCMTALFLAMESYVRRPDWMGTVIFAAALGVTSFSREMGAYLPLVYLPAALYPAFRKRGRPPRFSWLQPALVMAIPLLLLGGWMARNRHHTGYWALTSHTPFATVWYFTPKVTAAAWGITDDEARLRLLGELEEQYGSYGEDLRLLRRDPHYYWEFNHRLETNLRALPLARRHLLENFPVTAASFAGGAFWSLWAGYGEWRTLLGVPASSYHAKLDALVGKTKRALFRLDVAGTVEGIGRILGRTPPAVLAVFAVFWLWTLLVCAAALFGIGRLWRRSRIVTAEILLLVAFAAVVTGPAGNNRIFTIAYPYLSLLAAAGCCTLAGREDGGITGRGAP